MKAPTVNPDNAVTANIHRLRRLLTVIVVCVTTLDAFANDVEMEGTFRWNVIGPFENYSGSAFARKLDAERPFDTLTHKNARGGQLTWREHWSNVTSGLPLFNLTSESTGAYIANTFVESKVQQRVTLHALIAGSMEIYVNDSLAFRTTGDILSSAKVPISVVTLEQGWNRIMVKAGNNELPFCMFALHMTDASARIISDFASTPEPRLYPKQTTLPEPLYIADSAYSMGYQWDDASIDSLIRGFDAQGLTANTKLLLATQKKLQGLLSVSAQILAEVVADFPERYDAWFLKGYVHNEMQQKDSAIYCLEQGLLRDPGAYGPVALLRSLRNQPDIFSYFQPIDVDSILRDAMSRDTTHGPGFDIILHDEKAVVLSGGSSVVETDQVFQLNDAVGVAIHSAYPLENAPNAVSISVTGYKSYGDTVVSEVIDNKIMFDDLEVGDYVRIRRRYIARDTTATPRYYHHRHELQRRMYTHRSRYQVILPSESKFQWRTYHTLAEPLYTQTPLGYMLSWDDRNIEALDVRDEDMPRADLTGSIEVTTIPSWEYLAQRYTEAFSRNISPIETGSVTNQDLIAIMNDIAPQEDSLNRQEIIQRARLFLMNRSVSDQSPAYPNCRSIDAIMEFGPRSHADLVTTFVAMLSLRNIIAYPMIVDTTTTALHTPPTPSLPFNHMIAVVPGDSLPAFYDLSQRPMQSINSLSDNVRGAFGLVIRKGLREPMYVASHSIMTRFSDEVFRMTPVDDSQAVVFQSRLSTDLDSSLVRMAVNAAARQFAQPNSPALQMPRNVIKDSVWFEHNPGSYLLRFCRSGPNRALMARDSADTTRIRVWMPWNADVMYPAVPYDTTPRRAPLLRRFTFDSTTTKVVIHAPKGFAFDKKLPRGLFNVESIRYSIISIQQGDSLTVIRKVVNTQPWVSVEGFPSFQVAHQEMTRLDQEPVFLVPKPTSAQKRKKSR